MPAINPKVIQELRDLQAGGSPTFLAELIDLFLQELAGHMARLRTALEAKEAQALERTAHTLKGSSGNLGADTMSNLSADLQAAARAEDWPRAAELIGILEKENLSVQAELQDEKRRT